MTGSLGHDRPELAATYDRASDLQFETGKRMIERLGIAEGSRVLDVGCGTGRLTHWIAERVGSEGSVVGVDPLEERIAIARAQSGAAQFQVGRAEDLDAFDDASFDVVCMSSVLHWIADKKRALAETRRVLRSGGRLGATIPPHELSRASTVASALHSLLGRAPYAGRVDLSALGTGQRCTSTEIVLLVLDSGLELVELHVTPHESVHESGDALVDFAVASSFGNLLQIVPQDLRPSFRADLVAGFEALRGPNGVVARGFGALVVATRT